MDDKLEMNQNLKETFSIVSMFKLCNLHKKFLTLFIGITIILTGLYSFIIPQEFSASSSVLPPTEEGTAGGLSGFLQSVSGGISLGGLAKGLKIELYLEMLTSRSVAEYIVQKCELKKNKDFQFNNDDVLYDVVRNMLDVEANRSGLMLVNTTIRTPYFPDSKDKKIAAELAANIANAAVEGLDLINRQKTNIKAQKKRVFISRMLDENKRKLDSVDALMENFQENNKVLAIDEQTQAILENSVGIGVELSKSEADLGSVLQEYEPNSPIVKAYKRRVDDLSKQYEKAQIGGLIPSDKFSIPLQEIPKLIREYANLLREQKILTQVILYLETQKYQEGIQSESDFPTIQALDFAYPPYKKSSPSVLLMLVLAFFLSSILGITYITAKAFRKGNLYLEKKTDLLT